MRKRLPDDPKAARCLKTPLRVPGGHDPDPAHARIRAKPRAQAGSDRHCRTGARDERPPSACLGPSHSIETRFPLVLKEVEADANQLEMALLNLTVNARDALDDGGEIIVAAREENLGAGNSSGLKPGPYICLSVIDKGEGMDEATLRSASEPFFTTEGTWQRNRPRPFDGARLCRAIRRALHLAKPAR